MTRIKHSQPSLTATSSPIGKLAAGVLLASLSLPLWADVAPITTEGNKVLFGGQVGSVAGNSLFWSNTGWGGEKYYSAGTVAWLKSDWKAGLVRAAMGVEANGGYLDGAANKTANMDRVKAVVDAAIANDIYVIIDWHTHNAEEYQAEAISFFKEMATLYGGNHHVIYEIYNEPDKNLADGSSHSTTWAEIKSYAEAVIPEIRAIDPDNLIIVGTPTWSQDVDIAANDPITGYDNIAYTLHFYAGTHTQYLRDKAQTALNKGLPLFVTEWGSVNASGDGAVATSETNAWMSFLRTNNISHANWALNDKAEGASALVAGASGAGGWVSSELTPSGALTKSYMLDWPALNNSTPSSSSAMASSMSSTADTSSAAPSSTAPSSTAPSSTTASSAAASSIAAESSSAPAASSTATASSKKSSGGGGGGSSSIWLLLGLLGLSCIKRLRR